MSGSGANPVSNNVQRDKQSRRTPCANRDAKKDDTSSGSDAFVATTEPTNLGDFHDEASISLKHPFQSVR
jgi:hypothetical protein